METMTSQRQQALTEMERTPPLANLLEIIVRLMQAPSMTAALGHLSNQAAASQHRPLLSPQATTTTPTLVEQQWFRLSIQTAAWEHLHHLRGQVLENQLAHPGESRFCLQPTPSQAAVTAPTKK
jgi:hypothetical protein